MRLEPSRRLAVSLSLGMLLSLGAVLPTAATAATPPSTLTSESLTGSSTSGNSLSCPTITYTVSGTATGPYPGTFTESGTVSINQPGFAATFTITAADGTVVTGQKTVATGLGCGSAGPGGSVGVGGFHASYTATIHTPSGNYRDQGTSTIVELLLAQPTTGNTTASLNETYTSTLTQPTLIVPTSKDQCKDGGWQNYPQFKNQGQCVSFVETGK